MKLTQLLIFYGVLGAASALALLLWQRRRGQLNLMDVALLGCCWPLYGPFVWMRLEDQQQPAHEMTREPDLTRQGVSGHWPRSSAHDALEALRRAGGAPLAALLPDLEAGQRLSARMDMARQRVREIEALLARDALDITQAQRRQRELRERGDAQSADMIDQRIQMIRRLGQLRDAFWRELTQIEELLTQLELQAEVVRIAGSVSDDTRTMAIELVARLQGLEEVMGQDTLEDHA